MKRDNQRSRTACCTRSEFGVLSIREPSACVIAFMVSRMKRCVGIIISVSQSSSRLCSGTFTRGNVLPSDFNDAFCSLAFSSASVLFVVGEVEGYSPLHLSPPAVSVLWDELNDVAFTHCQFLFPQVNWAADRMIVLWLWRCWEKHKQANEQMSKHSLSCGISSSDKRMLRVKLQRTLHLWGVLWTFVRERPRNGKWPDVRFGSTRARSTEPAAVRPSPTVSPLPISRIFFKNRSVL